VDDLHEALAASIEELTRPIDAIKHQAKTVTVGTSRSESELLGAPLVAAVQRIGIRRDRLAYRTLRTLAALGPAVVEVTGFTRYQVGRSDLTGAVVSVVDQGGSARGLRSRTENDPTLRGTKHRAVAQRDVIVAVGRGDARPVVIVPELKGREVVGLGLLHVRLADRLDAAVARGVLTGYGRPDRLAAIVDAVNELNPSFDDRVLGTISVAELLTSPIQILAGHWSCQSEGPDPLRQGVRSES
jgi:glucosamine--fructose-6-phosphate aminotransferase (isomerizing)